MLKFTAFNISLTDEVENLPRKHYPPFCVIYLGCDIYPMVLVSFSICNSYP